MLNEAKNINREKLNFCKDQESKFKMIDLLECNEDKQINELILKDKLSNVSKIENKNIKSNLKKVYLKYLIQKKINRNDLLLRKSFTKFIKNIIIINSKENRRKSLLKNILKFQEQIYKLKLRKAFNKFYLNCKLLNKTKKSFCFKNFQDDFILMQSLYYLFYQKEKSNILLLKKYFDKFRMNTLLKYSNLIDNKYIDFDRRNKKLKLIITKMINHNNIIIKSILKQWLLRSKLFKYNIFEDKIKNNNDKNTIQKDQLLKGITKLNYIFKIFSQNNREDEKEIQNNEAIKKEEGKNNINEKKGNIRIQKENKLQKMYRDKYCTDCILEEKDEDQIDEYFDNNNC